MTKSCLNDYFDNIYVLNVDGRSDRMKLMASRLQFFNIQYERFNAITGQTVKYLHANTTFPSSPEFQGWPSANTLACNLSHLSIYVQALARKEKRILIIEDDVRIHRNIHALFSDRISEIESTGIPSPDLLYLCYIPVTPDGLYWSYSLITHLSPAQTLFKASNLWSLMAYGISEKLMSHMVDVYNSKFPMEIDRYFVSQIQPGTEFVSLGISPSLISGDNLGSDNLPILNEVNYMERTVDTRFSNYWDYV